MEENLVGWQYKAIHECVSAFEKEKGKNVKFLNLNGLCYRIIRTHVKDLFNIRVTIDKKPLHEDLGVNITELYNRIVDIAEDRIKYNMT